MGLIKYKSDYGDIAEYIKNEFEVKYSLHWCCIVYDGINAICFYFISKMFIN